ncbi:hypothetical protein FHL15_007738 [Xylaria flabelliformis]|uniref:Uncharacterized protein n=1 Tax=Xylaria flabelliformis TaxID=2512241 RepID=A0A553HTN7_9PEZI|nr:hypothetical protein FHL15_007738 [Xylaria flabelliformis]
MDENPKMTLREALTQAKPVVSNLFGRGSRDRPEILGVRPVTRITRWDDFCMKTLNDEYGPLLDREMSASACASVPKAESELFDIKIRKLTDIPHLIQWNDKMVNATLSWAKDECELCPGLELQTNAVVPNAISSSLDHWIALDNVMLQPLVNGMAWLSSTIKTRKIFNGVNELSNVESRPLQQLAYISQRARYGYIMTDRDLLVCRFSKAPSGDNFEVSLMLVPWSASGSSLTTDLAIWWLCMKALSEKNRELQSARNNDFWELIYGATDEDALQNFHYDSK